MIQVFLLVLLIDSLRADLLTALHAVVIRVLLVLASHVYIILRIGLLFHRSNRYF